MSDDGLTWRLKLREGIPFHKGWGIWNAHDYVWAIDNILEEGGRHPLVPHMRRIYRAEGASVKVIDDYTVEVNTGDAVAFDFT